MNTKNIVIGVLVLIIISLFAFFYSKKENQNDGTGVVCTMDAKLCPDGSYVGRVAPKCEFAPCKTIEEGTEVTLQAKINQTVSGLGVAITPLEVLEDSRCALNVVCIQAGTVRVRATLQSALGTKSTQIFSLNTPVTTEAETILLTEVLPKPYSGIQLSPSDYQFTFKVEK